MGPRTFAVAAAVQLSAVLPTSSHLCSIAAGCHTDVWMVASSAGPSNGRGLFGGRYSLQEQIGRGGTAEVYRAVDTQTGRAVALKRCLPAAEADTQRRRSQLEREFHTLAQLAHPRIIEVYEYGLDGDDAYYTMELLDGGDLSGQGQWPWQRACSLLADVASSLSILHSRGLLHRDISARNVRRGSDQRVKLIDFGLLASTGTALEAVGTPPYVPPEALQMQVLDARADLFSLGALAYYLLSGRHAFPARRLSELRDTWRSRPRSLDKLRPDLPVALVVLTKQLLSLDRMARPPSAADVMRRLCAIAGLPLEEELAVSRAYLATPLLTGRDALQVSLRKTLLGLVANEGETLLIEGAPGSGRTRALDLCVLDGRMLGIQVVRADASLGADGDWGVARAIFAQLVASLPRQAEAVALPLKPWLGPALAELRDSAACEAPRSERNARIRGMRDFVLALAHRERLLIAVDDVDCIDEPSLSLLAALSGHARGRGLLLVATLRTDDAAPARRGVEAALGMLRERGRRLPLPALTLEETRVLLRTVFGGTPHAGLLAEPVHALARGNPRDTMELAQHLVERGIARYEAGTWIVPQQLSEHDLPHSIAATLLARVDALSDDARELAELTAVSELPGLTAAQYESLCDDWEHGRLYRSLQELVAARVLLCAAEHYALCSRAYAEILLDAMANERSRAVHARWVKFLALDREATTLRVSHMFDAGMTRPGVELLLSVDMRLQHPRVALLERALAHADGLSLPLRDQHELCLGLLTSAAFALDVPSFARWAPRALAALTRDSGLDAYAQAPDTLDPSERLRQALQVARQHWQVSPESLRGYTVPDAIARLARLATTHAVMAIWTYDVHFVRGFPALHALRGLAQPIGWVCDLLQIARDFCAGRVGRVLQGLDGLIARVDASERGEPVSAGSGPLDPVQRRMFSLTLHMLAGILKALHGIRACEAHARVLSGDNNYRANAWRVRQLFQLSLGNLLEAGSCGRRADAVRLQQGDEPIAVSGLEVAELYASTLLGELMLVRPALERVDALAVRYPGWVPLSCYGHAAYAALQGDFTEALQQTERGLALAVLGEHGAYATLAALRVQVLCEQGRLEEAATQGLAYQQQLQREQIEPAPLMAAAVARALSALGRHSEALTQLEDGVAQTGELAISGQLLGQLFETTAYVALAARDQARFEVSVAACALEYKKGQNNALSARLLRLFEAAREGQMRVLELTALLDEVGVPVFDRLDATLMRDRFGECVDGTDRAHCALSFILAQSERSCGYLFAPVRVHDAAHAHPAQEGLRLLGGIPDDSPVAELSRWAEAWLGHQPLERDLDSLVTQTAESVTQSVSESEAVTAQSGQNAAAEERTAMLRLVTADGREFEPFLLSSPTQRPMGVVMLEIGPQLRLVPTRSLLADVTALLVDYGDLGPDEPPAVSAGVR